MLVSLPEPNPRIEADPLTVDSRCEQDITALRKVRENLLDDIAIAWIILHGLRRTLHVHGAAADARADRQWDHFRVAGQAGHAVDDLRSGIYGRLSDDSLARIDRDWLRGLATYALNNRYHTTQLILCGHRFRIG